MTQELKQMIHRLTDAWNQHDTDSALQFYSDDYVGTDVAFASPACGKEGKLARFEQYWLAFPDLTFVVDEILCDGDRVSVFWTATGTHQGPMLRIPATGKRIEVQGANLYRLENGLIQDAHYIWDVAGILRAVGLLPSLPD